MKCVVATKSKTSNKAVSFTPVLSIGWEAASTSLQFYHVSLALVIVHYLAKFFLLRVCKELCKEGFLLPYCFKKLLPLRKNCSFGQTLFHVSTHPGVLQIFTMGDLQEIYCLGHIQHYRISFFFHLSTCYQLINVHSQSLLNFSLH